MNRAPQTMVGAIEISLRIGQRVRHDHDYRGKRVTGIVHGLFISSDHELTAEIVLDAAIVIPPLSADDREVSIWKQHLPAHELSPFDERDELIAVLLAGLEEARAGLRWYQDSFPHATNGSDDEAMARIDAAIAKATGGAS